MTLMEGVHTGSVDHIIINAPPSTRLFLAAGDKQQVLASGPACRRSAHLYLNLHARLKGFRNVDSVPFPTRESQRVCSLARQIL